MLPVQAKMTPFAENLLPSTGDCSETVISLHSLNGVGLRNSMPLLWMETVSANGVIVACTGSKHAGFHVSMLFTDMTPQAQTRLVAMARTPFGTA